MELKLLKENLNKFNIELNENQQDQLLRFYELLVRENEKMNLTAITDFEEVQEKHFLDSLALKMVLDPKDYVNLIDVGTGAGFPGLPLAVAFPSLQVTLMDALQKRTDFLTVVSKEIMSTNVDVIHGRSEELSRTEAHRERYDIAVSRAVASLPVLCEYCLPYVRTGGVFVAYKGKNSEEELASAENAISVLGGRIKEVREFVLPVSKSERTLICIEKAAPTPEKYPRRSAKINRQPLSL